MHKRSASLLFFLGCFLVGCGGGGGGTPVQSEEHPGHKTYRKYCRTCHQGGVAGSPLFGDKEAWAPRIEKGRDTLLKNTIEGIPPAMPKKGSCTGCTDEELDDAIDFMLLAVEEGPEPSEPDPSEPE